MGSESMPQDNPLERITKLEQDEFDAEEVRKEIGELGDSMAEAAKLETLLRVVEAYPDRSVTDEIKTYFKNSDKKFWSEDAVDQLLHKAEMIFGPEEIEKLKSGQ